MNLAGTAPTKENSRAKHGSFDGPRRTQPSRPCAYVALRGDCCQEHNPTTLAQVPERPPKHGEHNHNCLRQERPPEQCAQGTVV